ncbi:transporter substrate-binding domain-containing protein [Mangrovibacter sp. SLW1]
MSPFESKTSTGALTGFDIDLGNAICAQMQVKCQWVENSFDGLIPALKARKFDAILSSLSITDERKKPLPSAINSLTPRHTWLRGKIMHCSLRPQA